MTVAALQGAPTVEHAVRDRHWLDHGVLVYGPRKAGTTLFHTLLDGSPDLFVYPEELKLKRYARRAETLTADEYVKDSRIAKVSSGRLSNDTYTAFWEAARRDAHRHALGDLIRFDVFAVQQSSALRDTVPAAWCAKEVGGAKRDLLAFWQGLFPKGRVLFIVRDPLFTTAAVLRDRQRKGIALDVRRIGRETVDPLRSLRRMATYLEDPRVHFTVYEDLVTRPREEMEKVARFLGVPWTDAFLTPTMFGEPIVVRTSSRRTTEIFRGGEDWREGLTKREAVTVSAIAKAAQLMPQYHLNYYALRAAIARRGD